MDGVEIFLAIEASVAVILITVTNNQLRIVSASAATYVAFAE